MSKHTPLPFIQDGRDICHFSSSHNLHVIAQTTVPIIGDEDANAALIVRACNEYYDDKATIKELLEALKELIPEGWGDGTMDHMPGVKKARVAIAKTAAP